jgi:murein DD-endopeptidase MepM/ murein hydrolase activator NlpD
VADRCAPPPVSGRCCLLRPPGSFVRGFSACGRGGSHYGIDSGAGLGTAIAAGISGTVISVATGNPNCPYNAATDSCPSSCVNRFNYVKIRSDCGDPGDGSRDLIVYYLHVDRLAPGVGAGAHVNQGDVIAYVGNSGCSSGPHVHLEIVPVARGANAVLNTCASVDPASRYCP